jgi:hypothetical protein
MLSLLMPLTTPRMKEETPQPMTTMGEEINQLLSEVIEAMSCHFSPVLP